MITTNSDKSGDRQQQILDATLDLVATQGLINTSIGKISKRAKSSPGIIYHYFESKDEIMDTLFLQVITEMNLQRLWEHVDLDAPVLSRYKRIWLNKYHYHRGNPQKTVFLEQYKNSAYYTSTQVQLFQTSNEKLVHMGYVDIKNGTVVDLSLEVIYVMTLGVALILAKEDIRMDVMRDEHTLDIIAERVCHAVIA